MRDHLPMWELLTDIMRNEGDCPARLPLAALTGLILGMVLVFVMYLFT